MAPTTKMKALQKSTLVALAIFTFIPACDPAYPPIICNGCNETIEISATFSGEPRNQSGILLTPKNIYVQRRRGFELQRLIVKGPSGRVRAYETQDLQDARRRRAVESEVWIVNTDGIILGDRDDLRRLRAKH